MQPRAPSGGAERPARTSGYAGIAGEPIRIVGAYALFAALWILYSDWAVSRLADDDGVLTTLSMVKGWVFVAVTALMLYGLISRMVANIAARDAMIRAEQTSKLQALQLLDTVVESSPDAIYAKDLAGRYLLMNGGCRQYLKEQTADVVGLDDTALFPQHEAARLIADDSRIMEAGTSFSYEETLTTPAGARTFLTTKGPIRDGRGKITGVFGIARDITGRKQAEERVRESEALYRSMFENMLGGYAYHEVLYEDGRPVDFRYLAVNPTFTDLTGLTDVVGKRISDVVPGFFDSDPELAETYYRVTETGRPERFEWHVKALDAWFIISVSSTDRSHFVTLFDNITEQKRAQQRVEFLAYHDALTSLPNRVLAAERMKLAMAYADRSRAKTALLFLDLDHFKAVNDSIGHTFGDELLNSVADRLLGCVRETDTICRHGGDEFLIVLGDMADSTAVSSVAEKILGRMIEPFPLKDQQIFTSASIGIALYPDDGRDFETLLRKSDTAMYHAKEAGRNTFSFYGESMKLSADEHLVLRNGLRRGLENDEFVLHFQPQIDLTSGAVIGAEALIRWLNPGVGMVPPGRFIPIAEESGLIVPIGEWVLREACRQAVAWQAAGLTGIGVAVNLSALQFKRGNLVQVVTSALNESGLDPALLELELTESILIKDAETVLKTVQQLKALGLTLSIDDFGTGYSSLSYLKRFKVDKLKIDQSFVRDLASDPEDAAIVRAIIQMARSLGLRTIAEGVEDAQIVNHLRLFRCEEAQGYHFARPMPAADFIAHVRRTQVIAAV